MIQDSLQVRRVAIAYLHQGPITLSRQENLTFYDAITNSGVELPEMNAQQQELVLLNRPAAGQIFEVRVGSMPPPASPPPGVFVQAPFRLLVSDLGSQRPLKFFQEAADNVYEAAQKVWGARRGKLNLVEVTLVASANVNHQNGAIGFVKERLTKASTDLEKHLGRDFERIRVRLTSNAGIEVSAGGQSNQSLPLPGASIDLTVEPMDQDPSRISLTSTVKWQAIQMRLDQMGLPPELRQALGGRDILELNAEARVPSGYVSEVYGYIETRVASFLSAVGR